MCLVVSSAKHNGFSRIHRCFIATKLKHWEVVRQGVWCDTFQVQNTKWLWLVNTTINSNNVLCASFGLFPSYVAGILNSIKEINFYTFLK